MFYPAIKHFSYWLPFPLGYFISNNNFMQKTLFPCQIVLENGQKCPGNPGNVLEFQLGKRVATKKKHLMYFFRFRPYLGHISNFSKVQIQIIFLSVFHPPRDDNKIGIYESLIMHIINFSHFFYIFDFGNSPHYITPDKIGNNENCMIQVFSESTTLTVKCYKQFSWLQMYKKFHSPCN